MIRATGKKIQEKAEPICHIVHDQNTNHYSIWFCLYFRFISELLIIAEMESGNHNPPFLKGQGLSGSIFSQNSTELSVNLIVSNYQEETTYV